MAVINYVKFLRCTQTHYNNLVTKDPDCLYFVYNPNTAEKGALYLGNRLISGSSEKGDISISDVIEIVLDEKLSDGDILLYNEATEEWENHSLRDLLKYSEMKGATEDTDGIAGLVPVPTAGQQDLFLAGDGTWKMVQTIDEDLRGIVATIIGDDSGMSMRQVAENSIAHLETSVANLDELLNGTEVNEGLREKVKNIEDSIGDFKPVESKYLDIGEAISYLDTSMSALNDRLRWHQI